MARVRGDPPGALEGRPGARRRGCCTSRRGSPPTTARGWTWGAVFSSALLAGAYGKAGQPEKGLDILGTLDARNFEGFYEPELLRLRGELLLARTPGAHATAESCFRRAIELAQTRQEKSLELRAVMSLYRLSRVHGRRDGPRSCSQEPLPGLSKALIPPTCERLARFLKNSPENLKRQCASSWPTATSAHCTDRPAAKPKPASTWQSRPRCTRDGCEVLAGEGGRGAGIAPWKLTLNRVEPYTNLTSPLSRSY